MQPVFDRRTRVRIPPLDILPYALHLFLATWLEQCFGANLHSRVHVRRLVPEGPIESRLSGMSGIRRLGEARVMEFGSFQAMEEPPPEKKQGK